MTRARILGIGMGSQHVTPEVASALRETDYVIAADKRDDDGLLALRHTVCKEYGVPLVAVPDPKRERADPADYPTTVRDWHQARVAAYEQVLAERGGTAAFLVCGDPSLYDSTIRVVRALAERLPLTWDVLPGVGAPQLLAARHRIVLHDVGEPVYITTARRLREAVETGQRNIVVLLTGATPVVSLLDGLGDWSIWWGANLGTPSEELVHGRVADVHPSLAAARDRAKVAEGWVMDVFLLRAPGEAT